MTGKVLVLGSSGRVGGALLQEFALQGVDAIGKSARTISDQNKLGVDSSIQLVVNAAGVAHLPSRSPSETDVSRLYSGNFDLIDRAARLALEIEADLVHLSSTKAALTGRTGAYAASKRFGEERLQVEYRSQFERRGLLLSLIRIPAMLAPPYDAGKLRLLQKVWWAVPPIPYQAPAMSVVTLSQLILDSAKSRVSIEASTNLTDSYADWRCVRNKLRDEAR